MQGLPEINARYWLLLLIASVCGTNLGDLASGAIGLGFIGAFLTFSSIFLCMALAAKRVACMGEAYYWLAIVVSRAAATDIADFATHQQRLDYRALLAGSGVMLIATILIAAQLGQSTLKTTRLADNIFITRPAANTSYWTAMIVASTFGTMAADYSVDDLGFALGPLTAFTLAVAAIAVAGLHKYQPCSKFGYWATVLAIRAAATNLGDFLAGDSGLRLGLSLTSGAGLVLLALLTMTWPRVRVPQTS